MLPLATLRDEPNPVEPGDQRLDQGNPDRLAEFRVLEVVLGLPFSYKVTGPMILVQSTLLLVLISRSTPKWHDFCGEAALFGTFFLVLFSRRLWGFSNGLPLSICV